MDAADAGVWRNAHSDANPQYLAIALKLARSDAGVAPVGVQIERRDGRPLTARDLRLVKLPPSWVLAGESPARWYQPPQGALVAPGRRGPKSESDQRHRMVWDAYQQALRAAPRAPIRALLPILHVSDATARRWVSRARERAAELGWDDKPLPQKAHGFLRQDEPPPAETGHHDTGDPA